MAVSDTEFGLKLMRWIALAVVTVGALIATSIAITFRYSIVPLTPVVGVSRLDHWTGKIVHCHPSGRSHDESCTDDDDWADFPLAPKGEQPCTAAKPCSDDEVFGKGARPGRPVPEKK